MIGVIAGLVGTVIKGVNDHFADKRAVNAEARKVENEIKLTRAAAQAAAIQAGQAHEHMWELEAMRQAQSSWKDEWFVLLLSIPLILSFIPGMDGYVANGFAALEKTPEWYRYSVGVAIAASFGFRGLVQLFGKK